MNGEAVVTNAQAVVTNAQAVATNAQAVVTNAQTQVFVPGNQRILFVYLIPDCTRQRLA
jgi:hypothetical protein